jgi:hypothetical protein
MRSFIPASVAESDQYWHAIAEKCFALSSQMSAPTFFVTVTMNPYCPEYQSLKRRTGHFSDATLMSIIFSARLKFLMKYCRWCHPLENVTAFMWRIDYQQRGLPHVHILFWTDCDT